jgi:hypothetical protein
MPRRIFSAPGEADGDGDTAVELQETLTGEEWAERGLLDPGPAGRERRCRGEVNGNPPAYTLRL